MKEIKELNQALLGKKALSLFNTLLQDLGPIFIRIAEFNYFKEMMEKVLLFKEIAQEGVLSPI